MIGSALRKQAKRRAVKRRGLPTSGGTKAKRQLFAADADYGAVIVDEPEEDTGVTELIDSLR